MSDIRAGLSYEEKKAFDLIRKVIKRKPEVAKALLEGLSKDVACEVLVQVKSELADLMKVAQAFSDAAYQLAKYDKEGEIKSADD